MDDLTKLSREALDRRVVEVMTEMANIRSQVNDAKSHTATTGDYSDADWFRRAEHALRMRGIEHQKLAQEVGRRNRQEKTERANAREVHFVRIAKRRLDPALFAEILDEAKDAEIAALVNGQAKTMQNNFKLAEEMLPTLYDSASPPPSEGGSK